MIHPRTRLAAIAGSTALTLSLALAPAAMAQDGPEATIQSFMDAVAAKDFAAIPAFFCEAEAAQAAEFDLEALAAEMPDGMDAQQLLDAFVLEILPDTVEVLSQTDTEAVVDWAGTLTLDLDSEKLVPFVEGAIEMAGMEVDEATVEMFMTIVASEFQAESQDIDAQITLTAGPDGAWLICSDLEFGGADLIGGESDDGMADDEMSDDAMTDEDMSDDEMEEDGE